MIQLFIYRQDRFTLKHIWSTGDDLPLFRIGFDGDAKYLIQVSGEALALIRSTITGIRDNKSEVLVEWTGEDAIFIWNSLRQLQSIEK